MHMCMHAQSHVAASSLQACAQFRDLRRYTTPRYISIEGVGGAPGLNASLRKSETHPTWNEIRHQLALNAVASRYHGHDERLSLLWCVMTGTGGWRPGCSAGSHPSRSTADFGPGRPRWGTQTWQRRVGWGALGGAHWVGRCMSGAMWTGMHRAGLRRAGLG